MAGIEGEQHSSFDAMVQLITLDCDAGRPISPERLQTAMSLAGTSQHTPGTALILARLGRSVRASKCPRQVPPETWLELTSVAIRGPNGSGIARMVRVERADLFIAANRLDSAIAELKEAYGHGRRAEPRVAFYAAALLATAGRYDEARAWAKLPMGAPWSWSRWVSQTDRQALDLLEAIDQAEREARRSATESQISAKNPP